MNGVNYMRVFLGIIIIAWWQGSVDAQWSELYDDLKICKGKPTGMSEFAQEVIPSVATCLTRTGKWCKALCAIQRLGLINETGYIDKVKGRNLYLRTTKITNPTRDLLWQDLETCIGNDLYEVRGKCENLRKAVYCFYNKYYVRCKIIKPKKDPAVQSAESGLLNDAVDGVGILGVDPGRPNPT